MPRDCRGEAERALEAGRFHEGERDQAHKKGCDCHRRRSENCRTGRVFFGLSTGERRGVREISGTLAELSGPGARFRQLRERFGTAHRLGFERSFHFAETDFVSGPELHFGRRLPVHESAVRRAEILEKTIVGDYDDFRVTAGNGNVFDPDRTLRSAADRVTFLDEIVGDRFAGITADD